METFDPLGTLTFNSQAGISEKTGTGWSIGWWEGRVTLPSGEFVLHVHTSGENDHTITEAARHAFEKMKSLEQAARSFAAEELLSIHNSEWSEGKPIDADEFMARLVPAAIEMWPNGNAEISYEDGDLFWGHEVGVRFRYGQFTEAVVQG